MREYTGPNQYLVHMPSTPRPPSMVSLVDLVTSGFLNEEDVNPGGGVNESMRIRAEREYADFMSRNAPRRPPLRPNTAPHVRSDAPRAHRPSSRTSAAHVHRIHVRRDHIGDDRVPVALTLDVCCICMSTVRNHVLMPCFHMCVCGNCASRVGRCPVCREQVQQTHRIYV